jgi:hypothetical protein
METPVIAPGALQKPIRSNIRKIRAESLKPPQEEIDESGGENHKFYIVFVSDGVEHKKETTKDVWRRARGPLPVPGRKVPGYDHKINHDFDILLQEGKVVGIDLIPKNKYVRGLVPEHLEDVSELHVRVDQRTGFLEVVQIPPKVRDNRVSAILSAIDAVSVIAPGDILAGSEVTQVAGNLVVIDLAPDA